jgi:hypothetical protein
MPLKTPNKDGKGGVADPQLTEFMQELRGSLTDAFDKLTERLNATVELALSAAAPAQKSERAAITEKDRSDLAGLRAAEAESQKQTDRFNELMAKSSMEWSSEDKQFIARLIRESLAQEEARQAALPNDPAALREDIITALKAENQ